MDVFPKDRRLDFDSESLAARGYHSSVFLYFRRGIPVVTARSFVIDVLFFILDCWCSFSYHSFLYFTCVPSVIIQSFNLDVLFFI